MLLELKTIVAGYGSGDILKGLSLRLEKGTTTCIVGPNGAGKSTVLRVISGLLKARQGSMTFQARAITGLTPRQILQQGIVQVPQEHSLFPDMTVRENVRLGGYLQRNQSAVLRRLHEIEELFPLVKERAEERASNLSGGQQRMVEFARSLMLDPTLILLDEPSMGLDPRTLAQVFTTIQTMQSMHKTILLVEQNVRAGFQVATHGIVMESGTIRMEGQPSDILANPDMSRLYLGGMLSS